MKLHEKLKFEREKQGYTLNELSELTGLHRITLHDYETGKIKNIPSDKILLLSKIYKKDPNYFLLDNDKNIKSHRRIVLMRQRYRLILNNNVFLIFLTKILFIS